MSKWLTKREHYIKTPHGYITIYNTDECSPNIWQFLIDKDGHEGSRSLNKEFKASSEIAAKSAAMKLYKKLIANGEIHWAPDNA